MRHYLAKSAMRMESQGHIDNIWPTVPGPITNAIFGSSHCQTPPMVEPLFTGSSLFMATPLPMAEGRAFARFLTFEESFVPKS